MNDYESVFGGADDGGTCYPEAATGSRDVGAK
jgi:hypothetical protein